MLRDLETDKCSVIKGAEKWFQWFYWIGMNTSWKPVDNYGILIYRRILNVTKIFSLVT